MDVDQFMTHAEDALGCIEAEVAEIHEKMRECNSFRKLAWVYPAAFWVYGLSWTLLFGLIKDLRKIVTPVRIDLDTKGATPLPRAEVGVSVGVIS